MEFNEYLQNALAENTQLRNEFNLLQPEYEIIRKFVEIREASKMTQKELARKCGIKQSNISRLERGKSNPTIKFLQKVAISLDCDLFIEFRKRQPVTESVLEQKSEQSILLSLPFILTEESNSGTTNEEFVISVPLEPMLANR